MPRDGVTQFNTGGFDGVEAPLMTPQIASLLSEGFRYHLMGNVDAARMHYNAVLLIDPDNPIALQNLSAILFSSQQGLAAVSVARRAMIAAPKNTAALHNHAAALLQLGQFPRCQRELEMVLEVVQNDGGIWHNYALVQYMRGHIEPAIEALEKGLSLRTTQDMRSDYGIFTLASGNIALGCERYESRWETMFKCEIFQSGLPEWKGDSIDGKRIILCHEQGMGDGIMLGRLVSNLQAHGAIVTLAVPYDLIRLFEHAYPTVPVIDFREPIVNARDRFDYFTPMLSCLGHLGLTPKTINPSPYISAEKWPGSLGPDGMRIGICWASGDHSPLMRLRRRVVPLELLFCLSEIPNVRLVSLQKGPHQDEILKSGAESFIFDPMSAVSDFYDTARIIEGLDLVISVDSAVVHLAGAMGKPTVMLGPYTRCWRWWGKSHGLPWYQDFRIFTPDNYNDWPSAVKQAKLNIDFRASEWRKSHG